MISPGQPIPDTPIKLVTADGATDMAASEALSGARVVFFTVPGAFTPTCHVNHLPGFVSNAAKLRAAGVTRIVCGAVNDHHVLKAWGEATGALGDIAFLADGNAALAKALGIDSDRSEGGMGIRFARAALVIENGVVRHVFVEDAPGVTGSGAPAVLLALEAA
jgi:peroxiredoxin